MSKEKKIVKILVGLFIIGTAVWGYHYEPRYIYELTFISNFSCGLLLFGDGLVDFLKKKSLPIIFYQVVLPCISTVFCTVIFSLFGWHDFNFDGMFFFMHIINPPLFLVVYLFCTKLEIKNKKDFFKRIFAAPIMIMLYVTFDLIRYILTGKLVYGLISVDKITCFSVPLLGIGIYLLMAFMSYGLLELKLFVQKWCFKKGFV